MMVHTYELSIPVFMTIWLLEFGTTAAVLGVAVAVGYGLFAETVAERIARAAKTIGDPSRIVATPDCGFGTLAGWDRVDTEIGWRKLEAMVDGAALASESVY